MPLPLHLTLFELRTLLGGELEAWGNPPAPALTELASFETADWGALVVLPERATPTKIARCRAGVVVGASLHHADWVRGRIQCDEPGWFLRVDDPARAFLRLLEGPCRPADEREDWLSVDETVQRWGAQARTAMIHRGARIGRDTRIGSGVVVHARVRIGEGCRIGEGSVLGAPGFGFSSAEAGKNLPLPHWAGLEIEPDVWIGPLCQISAGVLDPTWIGTGVRIDSLVQVAHNCRIGAGCVLAGQVGLAGSVQLGERCQVGGQAGFADHVTVGPDCRIAARAGVTKSWPGGVVLRGFPARTEKSNSCTP